MARHVRHHFLNEMVWLIVRFIAAQACGLEANMNKKFQAGFSRAEQAL